MWFKYFTCEVVDGHGVVIGSRTIGVPFWKSPISAHNAILEAITQDKSIINLRRI